MLKFNRFCPTTLPSTLRNLRTYALASAFFACAAVNDRTASAQAPAAKQLIEFPAHGSIRGSEELFRSPTTILVGEIHGTWETPLLVASLLRTATENGTSAVLCLEIASADQPFVDRFLQSNGGDAAVAGLLSGPHWSAQDGRASAGQFAMLELARRLSRRNRKIRVVALDIEFPTLDPGDANAIKQFAQKRDRAMAERVLAARKSNPTAHLLVLTGNVHAKITKGVSWDPDFKPMGWHVKQEIPQAISLEAQSSGGRAWVATENGVGPRRIQGVDRGSDPFIELFDRQINGNDGVLYVGALSASPPARGNAR